MTTERKEQRAEADHRHKWEFGILQRFHNWPEVLFTVEKCFACKEQFGVDMFRYTCEDTVVRTAFDFEYEKDRVESEMLGLDPPDGYKYRPANRADKVRYRRLLAEGLRDDFDPDVQAFV